MTHDSARFQADLLTTMKAVENSLRRAVREALIEHKRAGRDVANCTGGKVKWIPADEIVIPPEEPAST